MALTFPVSLTIDDCEDFIIAAAASDPSENLVLPVDAEGAAFGGFAAAIQALITWGRNSSARNLIIRGTTDSLEDLVEGTISRPHKFCAIMMARSIQDTVTNTNLRPILYVAAEAAIEKQATCTHGQQRGGLCWFVFVDHSTKGFDRNFYLIGQDKKTEIRQLMQIRSVINSMIEKSVRVVGGGKQLSNEDVDHIGRLFYELFLNSHEHGSRGHTRANWIKPGLRAIYSNAINLSPKGGESSLRGAPPIYSYLNSLEMQNTERRRFVEISIVDSGIGFCGRWIADHSELGVVGDLSLNEEYEIFKKCFTFRQTSSKSSTKGHGLPVVMDRLTKLKGFMKVRSGRLSLYRNFVANPYVENEICSFADWCTKKLDEEILTEMSPVSGVVVTLLIPLETK
jgi:hypothetical protein